MLKWIKHVTNEHPAGLHLIIYELVGEAFARNLFSYLRFKPWWRHQMETFSAILAICAGNSPVPGEFSAQRPVTRRFDVFFDLSLNKRLRKQSWGWWFKTISCPLWRHFNAFLFYRRADGANGRRDLTDIASFLKFTFQCRSLVFDHIPVVFSLTHYKI